MICILEDILGVERSRLKDDASFTTDLQADEMEPVEIALAIEEEFDLVIDLRTAQCLETVGDLVNWVSQRLIDDDEKSEVDGENGTGE